MVLILCTGILDDNFEIEGRRLKMALIQCPEFAQAYEQYKKFMGIQELPEFNIVKYDDNDTLGITEYLDDSNIYQISLSSLLSKFSNTIRKSIYFHELTHIMIEDKIFNECQNHKKAHDLTATYSEFYCSKIEMMVLLGFTKINQKSEIHLNDKIDYHIVKEEKHETVSSFIRDNYLHWTIFFKCYLENKTLKKYFHALNCSMYFLGYIDVLESYISEPISKIYTEFSLFADILGKKLPILYDYIRLIKEINLKNMEQIQDHLTLVIDKNLLTSI